MNKITVKNYRDSKDYGNIVAAVSRVLARQRHVSPIEVFLELGLLMATDLERWKRGQVPYLERVIRCNLSRAGSILRVLRFHAHDLNLGPSISCHHHRKQPLRFSKSGEHLIEDAYSRHFVVVGKNRQRQEKRVAAFAGESVIISDRNQRCLEVMNRELAAGHKNLGVFYGAAHFPDMEKRLTEQEIKRTKQEWLTAWDIPKKDAG